MQILLVAPSSDTDVLSRAVREIPFIDSEAFFAPHGLATVAALTPPEHGVHIHDEQMRGPVDGLLARQRFDVVGITLTTNQPHRAREIAQAYKDLGGRGFVVLGGIGAGMLSSDLRELADAVFVGEVEHTWATFLNDASSGTVKPEYLSITKPDLTDLPAPRWDLLSHDISRYGALSVQTGRGCPFDCDFCDVIYTYGRKLRTKTVDQVLGEVRTLAHKGVRLIYFADDNFVGKRRFAKQILRRLKELNEQLDRPLVFMTQADITIAKDDELLALLADSNFMELQIGVESFSQSALSELNKKQNLPLDLVEAIRKIQSYGLIVYGHFIVGCDADTRDTFAHLRAFCDEAHLVHHTAHPLMAPAGTKLWYELKQQGRLVFHDSRLRSKLDVVSNIVPKGMSRVELLEGLADYWSSSHDPDLVAKRVQGFIRNIKRIPQGHRAQGLTELWAMRRVVWKSLRYIAFDLSPAHKATFLSAFKAAHKACPQVMPRVAFLLTSALIDEKVGEGAARIARDHARWERDHGDQVRILSTEPPLSPQIREHAEPIFELAFLQLRGRSSSTEDLYQNVLEAASDYASRCGSGLCAFDDTERGRLIDACDRVTGSRGTRIGSTASCDTLPAEPPPGFAREMLNALDRTMRARAEG